jgi:hypothetical protein
MRHRQIGVTAAVLVLATGLSSAWAFVVSDVAVTAQNAITALLKNDVLETLASAVSASRANGGAPECPCEPGQVRRRERADVARVRQQARPFRR